jgi:hypothetical protein
MLQDYSIERWIDCWRQKVREESSPCLFIQFVLCSREATHVISKGPNERAQLETEPIIFQETQTGFYFQHWRRYPDSFDTWIGPKQPLHGGEVKEAPLFKKTWDLVDAIFRYL